ncbi:MAG: SRPBCC domain-containing protein [Proteobacteria bacterium]|nr:SRPBCC domain-containing protein [Pseudomonadota bacterium]
MTATVSRLIPALPAEVWETLTSRDAMKEFMQGAVLVTDWTVGHSIKLKGQVGGEPFVDRGEIRSFEPRKRLSYTHESAAAPGKTHLVTFELAEKGRGTKVTVTQTPDQGIDASADEQMKAQYEKTWAMILRDLEAAVLN